MELLLASSIAATAMIFIIWWVLSIIGYWKIFEKAGKPGWHSLIPFLNVYDEYDLCWNGMLGIVYMVVLFAVNLITPDMREESGMWLALAGAGAVCVLVLQIVESYKLAKAFGKGIGYTIFLVLFDRFARIVLGFSSAQYVGKED